METDSFFLVEQTDNKKANNNVSLFIIIGSNLNFIFASN